MYKSVGKRFKNRRIKYKLEISHLNWFLDVETRFIEGKALYKIRRIKPHNSLRHRQFTSMRHDWAYRCSQ